MSGVANRGARRAGQRWTTAAVRDLRELSRRQGCRARVDEPLARHTSMGVGGPTPLMVWPTHPDQVIALTGWMGDRGLPWRVLGGGTNVLVSESGIDDPVLSLTRLTGGLRLEAPEAILPAGLPTARALKLSLQRGLAGLVWTTGLPGTVGGAAAGNAGCWGGQMADVVRWLDVVTPTGAAHRLSTTELRWDYRHLDLEERVGAGAVIVGMGMSLEEADPEPLAARSQELHRIKRERQPLGARNAGCIFRNPDADTSAGKLIDEAGCKGLRVGDAEVSALHGNFIINHGGATSGDVGRLIETIREAVVDRCGVRLEEEIRRW